MAMRSLWEYTGERLLFFLLRGNMVALDIQEVRPRRDRNSVQSIIAAIVPVAIAGTPITVQPGMVQGMVDYLNMGDVQAGVVASAEVTGLMAATVLFAFVSGRLNWRWAYAVGMLVMIAGNLISTVPLTQSMFMIVRTVTGLGAGLVTAIGFASLGETSNPQRNYGWAVAGIIGYSAVALWALPTLFNFGGYDALITAYAVVSALCLLLVSSLPHVEDGAQSGPITEHHVSLLSLSGGLGVSSVLIFFIGYAAAWTYMALLGRDAGLADVTVSHILSISQFFGVGGALSIVLLSGRMSDISKSIIILSLGAGGIFAFAFKQDYFAFLALNSVFQFAWNAGQPLLLGIIASRDKDGTLLRFAIPMQYIGLAVGPAFAAYLLGTHHDYEAVMIGSALVAGVSLFAILPLLIRAGPARSEVEL
jgi:predicted MFS family arabinose efflux permease